jgi:hypothetical protein
MADPNAPEIWSWLDSLWGFGVGIVAAVLGMLGWVNPKLRIHKQLIEDNAKTAHHENDALAGEVHGRITSIEKLIVALQENNREYMRLYTGVKDELKSLSVTTAEQTKILYQMRGALNIKGDDHG